MWAILGKSIAIKSLGLILSRKDHLFVDCSFILDHGRDPKVLLKETPAAFGEELRTISHMVMGVDSIVGKML